MDAARGAAESRDPRFDELYAEAKSTLGYGANSLRSVTERYREAYGDSLARWHRLRDLVDAADRAPFLAAEDGDAASAAEAGAEDARQKTMRTDVERQTGDLGKHQQELSKLELSVRSMENAWLFLERGDASLLAEVVNSGLPTDLQMRIVQAQEAERSRLAQEVHDGPPRLSPTPSSRSSTSSGCSTRTLASRTTSSASCASCCAASWARSAPSSASSARRSWTSSASTARSWTPSRAWPRSPAPRSRPTCMRPESSSTRASRPPSCGLSRKRCRTSASTPARVTPWCPLSSRQGTGFWRSATTAGVRRRYGRSARPAQLRPPVHARTG